MHPKINILLIEDNIDDATGIAQALGQYDWFSLTTAANGEAALAVLRGEGGQLPFPRPYIILLDLYLPKIDGFAFLQALRQDPDLRSSIVFVITLSVSSVNKIRTYHNGIAGYFPKESLGTRFEKLGFFLSSYCPLVQFPEV